MPDATLPSVDDAVALGLTRDEYALIVDKLEREPNEVELAVFSLLWSEHCSYKHSRALLRTLPTAGERVVMGPGENAGAVDVGGGWAVAFKVESHNHPSAVEPFQGAATGVGGILRDVFAIGARPIAVLDSLRFGDPSSARSRYLLDRAVAGIGHYGNSVGVPTVGGEVYFEGPYEHNCLVNAMALGLARREDMVRSAAAGVGNVLVLFGASTGRDGIGGASVLASAELGEGDADKRPTVQVGDPFEGKKVLECSLELLDRGLLVSLQDLGAAGLTSSSAEMASKGGVGVDLDVARVPLRETDMAPFEIMISESQERMLCVVEPARVEEALAVCEKWEVHGTAIGEVTGTGRLCVRHGERVVGDMPVAALVDECPVYELDPRRPASPLYPVPPAAPPFAPLQAPAADSPPGGASPAPAADSPPGGASPAPSADSPPGGASPAPSADSPAREPSVRDILLALLASPNVASRLPVYQQYDWLVQARTVRRPGDADAAVLLMPTGGAIAVSIDGSGRRVAADPHAGTVEAVLECAANLACVGAEPLGLTNCLNFANPQKPHIAWQLSESVRGLGDACRALGTPVVGGNVSLYNEGAEGPIYPTPVVGMVGELPDPARAGRAGFAREGHLVALVGAFTPVLGASELARLRGEALPTQLPEVDLAAARRTHEAVRDAVRAGDLSSAHDVAEGGLLVAIAESCLAGGLGARVASRPLAALATALTPRGRGSRRAATAGRGGAPGALPEPLAAALFGEAPGTAFVVSAGREALDRLERRAHLVELGTVGGDALAVGDDLMIPLAELRDAHASLGALFP